MALGKSAAFILAVLEETITSEIFDKLCGKKSPEEIRAEASQETAEQFATTLFEFDAQESIIRKELEVRLEKSSECISNAPTQKWVDACEKTINDQIKGIPQTLSTNDRSLYKIMLHDWILENAGTSNPTWEKAKEVAKNPEETNKKRGQWKPPLPQIFEKDQHLTNHPEIFIYQSRRLWNELGLDTDITNKIIDDINLIKEKTKDPAKDVMKNFNRKIFNFNISSDPLRKFLLIWFIREKTRKLYESEEIEKLNVECILSLKGSDGSVYIDFWTLRLVHTDGKSYDLIFNMDSDMNVINYKDPAIRYWPEKSLTLP